eukprot:GEZU01018954.1.p1 GENE.GEZU01018954.1~~GEZU01018954.1.p1  ORF type:complete len:357 (+),score=105.53 GEZU01018954.1:76-1146(+)
MNEIPRFEQRMETWLYKRRFVTTIAGVQPDIENLLSAAEEIQTSKKFLKLLEIILAVGNFLNAKSQANGNAYGFKMSTLLKIKDTKSADNSITLLQYIASYVESKYPQLLDLTDEIGHVQPATRTSIPVIQDELNKLKKGLQKVEQELEISKETTASDDSDRYIEVMSEFLTKAQKTLESLQQKFTEMIEMLKKTAEMFGEPESDFMTKPEAFFQTVDQFMAMFKQAHQDNIKMREMEEKKRKQAEAAAQKAARDKARREAQDTATSSPSSPSPPSSPPLIRTPQSPDSTAESSDQEEQKGIVEALGASLLDGSAFKAKREQRRTLMKNQLSGMIPPGAGAKIDMTELQAKLRKRM